MSEEELSAGGPPRFEWSFPNKYRNYRGQFVSGGMVWVGDEAAEDKDRDELHLYLSAFGNYHPSRVLIDERSTCGKLDPMYDTASKAAWRAATASGANTVVF